MKRGQYGILKSISVYELVVGDVFLVETGNRIPADCILIEGTDVTVDERFYHEDFPTILAKIPLTKDNKKKTYKFGDLRFKPDPFIPSQSLVVSGFGKAMVVAVGINSKRDTIDNDSNNEI